jgi:hypothetical protein
MKAQVPLIASSVIIAAALLAATASAQKKPMSCKLQSEQVIQGREKRCLYVCEDKSLEGRTRKIDSDCPKYITSDN